MGLRPGEIIDGRFRVDGLIGYGGQGVVLKVTHLEWDRELAMKLPLPEVVGSPGKRERFIQEAETWIRLGVHPHIVRCWFVHKVVGLPALFLDLIPGGSLEDRLKSKSLVPGDWCGILKSLLQVAEGLAHAHSMGVVHRDIKPENLLLRNSGQIGVTDFGLVKAINRPGAKEEEPEPEPESESPPDENQDPGITGTQQFLGTPRYGAPEQWNKAMTIGPTTDIYALGVILYEMICGRRPFDAPEETVDVLELIQRHLHQPPLDPRDFYSDVPETLARLALHCLQKDPAQRPQSMLELLGLLGSALKEICGEEHRRPKPVPGGDRADLLNNAAYSLYSLSKVEKARSLLHRGLMLEAGHPECLYNLVQLDRREGRISPPESLRRLQRANANYQLALLFIEEGMGKRAMDLIDSFPEEEKHGLVYRTQGDALMYAKQYLAAQRAYEKAQQTMPSDQPTRLRKLLAMQGLRGLEGHVFFPSSVSCYKNRAPDPELSLLISQDSQTLIGINAKEVVILHIDSESAVALADRTPESTPAVNAWVTKNRLMVQDAGAFELWDTNELRLLQRTPGRVLAASDDLKRLVLLKQEGVIYIDKLTKTMGPLKFPPGTQPSGTVRACFTADGSGLCVLTPSGQIGQVDAEFRVNPLAWPPSLPGHHDVVALRLSPEGMLYTIHRSGLFQCADFANQKPLFSFKVPFSPQSLELDRTGQTVIISSETHFGVFRFNGELLYRGAGPFAIDSKKRYGMGWANGSLTLFELSPFRRVRSWAERIPVPRSIHIAKDGRRAASLEANGTHYVWEVDEENRVYEHNLLLTPGQTYADLISGYERYKAAFSQATDLYQKGQFFNSYLTLRKARAVKGFSQSKEALGLHRELSRRLRRGGLEAIWERFNLVHVNSVALAADPSRIAIAQGRSWSLLSFRGSRAEEVATGELEQEIVGLHCYKGGSGRSLLAIATRNGMLVTLNSQNGEFVGSKDLQSGQVEQARFFRESLFLVSGQTLTHVDINQGVATSSMQLSPDQLKRVFPLSRERAVVQSSQGPVIVNLKQRKAEGALPIKLPNLPAEVAVTWAEENPERKIFSTGFSDGSFAISDPRSGKIYFGLNKGTGPVTGSSLALQLAVGVIVSSTGKLVLFDLSSKEVFERFTAHAEGIAEVHLTEDGSYMVTRTVDGNCRLWELSWALTDSTSPLSIEWLPAGAFGRLGMLFKSK